VAAQADAVSIRSGPVREGNDLRNIAATLHVQAARAVARFAIKTLLSMKGVLEVRGDVGVAARAGIRADRRGAWNLHILCERGDPVGRLFLC